MAEAVGVSRQTLHTWLRRYEAEGLEGLADRSHRPGGQRGDALITDRLIQFWIGPDLLPRDPAARGARAAVAVEHTGGPEVPKVV